MIQIFQPALGDEELEAVRKVFASNWIGKGRLTDQFEAAFASHLHVERPLVRSASCCTEGLFQSMNLLGVGPGDEVVLPTISFVGAGNAVAACGARPVFCDVDPRTLNATADTIERKLTPRTKAVMILHYGGVPCRMDEILDLVRRRQLGLVEDSANSVASWYGSRACGTLGDVGVWSFDAMKILVTGDGSMVYCRDAEMALRAEHLLYLGLKTASGQSNPVDTKWWEFEITTFGRRAIMNDIQSAIGLEQLAKLGGFVSRRREVHEFYNAALAGLDWISPPPPIPGDVSSSYYLYWVQTGPSVRDRLARFLKERGVYTTFRYYPLHWVSYYGAQDDDLPRAEQAARQTLCLPIHQSLGARDLEKVVECIREFGRTAL